MHLAPSLKFRRILNFYATYCSACISDDFVKGGKRSPDELAADEVLPRDNASQR